MAEKRKTRKMPAALKKYWDAKNKKGDGAPKAKGKKKNTLFGKPRGDVIKHPGAFKKKAQEAGMSTQAYAEKVLSSGSKASATTKKQAGLAEAFATMRKKKK